MSVEAALAGELKALAGEASGIFKSFKRLHPEQFGKMVAGGGEPGIAATVSKEWSHIAEHWRPSFEIPHADIQLVENFAKGHTKVDEQVLQRVKKTIDEAADLAAVARHGELRKSGYTLQGKLLAHEHQFHAPDYRNVNHEFAPDHVKTMYNLRSATLEAMPEVIKSGETHEVVGAFGKAGGLTKAHRDMILDPVGVLQPREVVGETMLYELGGRQHTHTLGEAIAQRTKSLSEATHGKVFEAVSDHSPVLREQTLMHTEPEKWKQICEERAARAAKAGATRGGGGS